MAAPIILVVAQPRRSDDGTSVTVRLAGGGGDHPLRHGGQHWLAGIVQLPTMVSAIDFGNDSSGAGEFGAGGVPSALEIEWAPSDMALLAQVAGYYWTDAPVTVFIGPDDGAMPAQALAGKALSGNVSGGVLTIAMSDPVADLKKPLPFDRFGGTGDLDGPAEWTGKIKRRLWGRLWNVAGEPLDKANNIWCFGDPLRPIEAISSVRDRGATGAGLTLLAWQGTAMATLTALRAAVPPAGGGVACPSIACVKWWAPPTDLTADLRGEIGTGYVETTAQIVERIVQAGANLPFAAGTVAAAVAARPAPVGWVAESDTVTQATMIETLLGNSSLLWLLDNAGQIVLRPWEWGASVASGRSNTVKRLRTLKPVGTRQIGYRRNEHVMERSALAGIVLAQDTLFDDGQTLADLKPAEADATKGAPVGTNIGDRPVEDVLSALDEAGTNISAAQDAIDALFETYGDTESAATSAASAAISASAAGASASSAHDDRVIATDAAAAAQSSQVLAASVGLNAINRNPVFSAWSDPAALPESWGWWAGGAIERVAGANGGYAVRFTSVADVDHGLGQGGAGTALAPGQLGPGWYVLEAEVRLEAGSLQGAGLYVGFWDAGSSYITERVINFATDPDSSGAVVGAGTAGRTYRFSKLVNVTSTSASSGIIHPMSNWSGFGTRAAKTLDYRKASIVPARQEEIARQTVLAPLEATVSTQAGVIADRLTGSSAAYLKQVAIAGSGRAELSLWANGNGGGGVDIVGDVAIHGNLLVSGSVAGAKIVDLGVDTAKLAMNSVTKIGYVATGTNLLNNFVEVVCAEIVFNKKLGSESVLKVQVCGNARLQDNAKRTNRIKVDGTIVWQSDNWPAGDDTTLNTENYTTIVPGLAAGDHTITFTCTLSNGATANFSYMANTFLDAVEYMR